MSLAGRDAAAPVAQRLDLGAGPRLNLLHWAGPADSAQAWVLVHGLGDHAGVWQGVAPGLALGGPVHALDLRGHGASDWVADADYRVADMARDLLAMIDTLGLTQPVLVGHSLGGAVVSHALAVAPQRFAGAALVDYAPEMAPASVAQVRAALSEAHRPYPSIDAYAAQLKRRHLLAAPDLIARIAAQALRLHDGAYLPAFDPAVLTMASAPPAADAWAHLGRLTVPMQVIRGAWSWIVPRESAERVAQSCPDARLATVPMAGHSVQIDNPKGLLRVLAEWAPVPA